MMGDCFASTIITVFLLFGLIPVFTIFFSRCLQFLKLTNLSEIAEQNFLKNPITNYIRINNLEKKFSNPENYATTDAIYPFGFRIGWRKPHPVFRHFLLSKIKTCSVSNRYYGIGDAWFKDGRVNLLYGMCTWQFTPGRLEDVLYFMANNNAFLCLFLADNSSHMTKPWRMGLKWFAINSLLFLVYTLTYEVKLSDEQRSENSKLVTLLSVYINFLTMPVRIIFDILVSLLLKSYHFIPIDDNTRPKSTAFQCCSAIFNCAHALKDFVACIFVVLLSYFFYIIAGLYLCSSQELHGADPTGWIIFNYLFGAMANSVLTMFVFEVFIAPKLPSSWKIWDKNEYFGDCDDVVILAAAQDKLDKDLEENRGCDGEEKIDRVENPLRQSFQISFEQ